MKTLKRIPQKGIVAGVIAGFAEYFLVDVTVLRVLFVFFVLCTGFFPGVIGYFIAILIMPVQEPVIHEHKEEPKTGQQ
jgi:phage shock protein C